MLARCGLPDEGALLRERVEGALIRRLRDGSVQDEIRPAEHGRCPADVIEVEMGEDEEVEPVDAELGEAPAQCLRVGAGVDQGGVGP